MEQPGNFGADDRYDVVVIGGGAAGLAGALALARSRRRVLVIDDGQPRNAPAGHVHNYLGREGTPPADLLAIGRAEVAGYGGRVVSASVVSARRLDGDLAGPEGGFAVGLASGDGVRARRLLVATGAIDELPPVPGITERWGRDVLHCPYCHGWEARDQAIGVLATGPMTVHAALLWRQLSDDVVVFRHDAPPFPEEERDKLAARAIRVIDGEVAGLEVRNDRLVGIRLRAGAVEPRDVLVVASRPTARLDALAGLCLETTEMEMGGQVLGSHVAAGPAGVSGVPGVWVAGNVAEPMAQVIGSAAAGLMAGAHINADLVAEEAARAVASLRDRSEAAENPVAAR